MFGHYWTIITPIEQKVRNSSSDQRLYNLIEKQGGYINKWTVFELSTRWPFVNIFNSIYNILCIIVNTICHTYNRFITVCLLSTYPLGFGTLHHKINRRTRTMRQNKSTDVNLRSNSIYACVMFIWNHHI